MGTSFIDIWYHKFDPLKPLQAVLNARAPLDLSYLTQLS